MPEVPVKMSITDIFEKNSKKMSNFQYKNPILPVQFTNYGLFYFHSKAHFDDFRGINGQYTVSEPVFSS